MPRPALELAAIFRQHGAAYRAAHRLPLQHLRVMRAIETCRTAVLGGHVERCDRCHHRRISYNSCRNRHCPKCQNTERAKWLESRKAELLPVAYFHVVFTLPEQVARIAFCNQKIVYAILFRMVSQTLVTIAADRRHLGAEIGFFSILHTWGQNLLHHPHLHCVVPGGGLSFDQQRWIACRPGFFLPVRVLSRLFRRLMLEALHQAFRKKQLQFPGEIAHLAEASSFRSYLEPLTKQEWVVYSKPPFGGPRQVLEYLGRYSHRVALTNQRLLAADDSTVTFQWKDYRLKDQHKSRTLTLTAEEFMRRFLIHVLPSGFQRIRHGGFFANRHRNRKVALCRQLLMLSELLPSPSATRQFAQQLEVVMRRCPICLEGQMVRIELLPACRWPATPPDSS